MGRTLSNTLEDLLPLCKSQTTLEIITRDAESLLFATKEVSANSKVYDKHLKQVGEVNQSVFSTVDRTSATIQNIDNEIGLKALSGDLERAKVIIGRYYEDIDDANTNCWEEIYSGEISIGDISEEEAQIEILDWLVAAGYSVADWAFAPNCPLKFKDTNCGYSGVEDPCSKTLSTCRILHRFGGLEYVQDENSTEPGGGGIDPNTGDGDGRTRWDNCFTGETLITLPNGNSEYIQTIYQETNIGACVKSFDKNDEAIAGTILDVIRSETNQYLRVTFEDKSFVRVIPTHQFYVGNGKYKQIRSLKRGDFVIDELNAPIRIANMVVINLKKPVFVYNLEIETYKNYVANGKRVHNNKPIDEGNY